MKPPVAPRHPARTTVHDTEMVDPYAWLRQRQDAEVISYLEAENEHTEEALAQTSEQQEQLYREMVSRIEEDDMSVPARMDEYLYYHRKVAGQQYEIFCRRQGSMDADEEIVLDLNALAEASGFLNLGGFEVSPDHRWLAYSLDTAGHERYTLRIRDLNSGHDLDEEIEDVGRGLAWGNDNVTLYYTVRDAANRPYRAFRHQRGQQPSQDELILEELDERFFLGLRSSRSCRFVFLTLGSHTTSEVHYLDADQPKSQPRCLATRRQDVEFYCAHSGDSFFILTNQEAQNFQVFAAPIDAPDEANWRPFLPHRPEVKLEGLAAFKDHLVVYQRKDALRGIRVQRLDTGDVHEISFDEPVYAAGGGENPEFDTTTLRFEYSSLVTPRSTFDYDMDSRTRQLLKQTRVGDSYNAEDYVSERRWVDAEDGARIPVSLVYRRDRKAGGPALLYGYGSYGTCIDPQFSPIRLSLLDRGFMFAIAHIRGGSEMGRQWYENGKLEHKTNTFSDFIAVADALVASGATSHRGLVIRGGSAGGLLVGAVLNMRPDLCHIALAEVPFVDVVNTMLDPTIPLTVIEYEEWGNPTADPKAFARMLGYSPYDNVQEAAYPHILVTAGLNDPRVQYWEPAKWVARLRTRATGDHRLLLKTDMSSGHGGASGRYDAIRQEALKYAFVLDAMDRP